MMYGNDEVGDDDEEEDVDDNPTLRNQIWRTSRSC